MRYSWGMTKTCERCGTGITTMRAGARFCSTRCRVAAHRAAKLPLPVEMTSRDRWVRRTATKRPVTVSGAPASSTNPATWSKFSDARASNVGNGMGFVLGDGVGCYDLDYCIDTDGQIQPWVHDFILGIPERVLFAEVSMSGRGVHVFVEAPEGPGRRYKVDGHSVERYTRGQYIAVTGHEVRL